nr:MAG TPA: hypothetical protein [Bacteriophage sp.]
MPSDICNDIIRLCVIYEQTRCNSRSTAKWYSCCNSTSSIGRFQYPCI